MFLMLLGVTYGRWPWLDRVWKRPGMLYLLVLGDLFVISTMIFAGAVWLMSR
jgi:hypothetical protein